MNPYIINPPNLGCAYVLSYHKTSNTSLSINYTVPIKKLPKFYIKKIYWSSVSIRYSTSMGEMDRDALILTD